jgi:D-lactate dehydrogenase
MNSANHNEASFIEEARKIVNPKRLFTNYIQRIAWGTDASCYRQIPQVILFPTNEEEVRNLLQIANQQEVAVTFRAAGTSLSGQTITDSVMIVVGKLWEKYHIHDEGQRITMQPGIVGARVNEILQPYGRKFTPDPASLKSAMVGGIIMNFFLHVYFLQMDTCSIPMINKAGKRFAKRNPCF